MASGIRERFLPAARPLLDRFGLGKPLREIAAGRRRASILVGDTWHPAEYRPVIEETIDILVQSGVRESRITILIARGLRPPTMGLRPMRLYGEPTTGSFAIENAGLSMVSAPGAGLLPGADIRSPAAPFDPRWTAADIRILIGTVLPHPFVGWSGGADLICPGITGPMIAGTDQPAPEQDAGEFRKALESCASAAPPTFSCYILQCPFDDLPGRSPGACVALWGGEGLATEAFAAAANLAREAFLAEASPARDILLRPPDLSAMGSVLFALAAAARFAKWLEPGSGSRIWIPLAGEEEADEAADALAAIEKRGVGGVGFADPWTIEPAARGIEAIGASGAILRFAFVPYRRGARPGRTGAAGCEYAEISERGGVSAESLPGNLQMEETASNPELCSREGFKSLSRNSRGSQGFSSGSPDRAGGFRTGSKGVEVRGGASDGRLGERNGRGKVEASRGSTAAFEDARRKWDGGGLGRANEDDAADGNGGRCGGETVEIPDWAEIVPLPEVAGDLEPARTLYVHDPWRVIPAGGERRGATSGATAFR
ncbi:MAG: nickel-dependent lactate racemase [Planctomycetota bacterium]|nr:nickel-dependent lactate racemase [Planctomycetota bacterium]